MAKILSDLEKPNRKGFSTNMQIMKNASAGTMESSDVYVEIEPADELEIQLESVVLAQFGDEIIHVVRDVLREHDVEKAGVRIVLRGKGDA